MARHAVKMEMVSKEILQCEMELRFLGAEKNDGSHERGAGDSTWKDKLNQVVTIIGTINDPNDLILSCLVAFVKSNIAASIKQILVYEPKTDIHWDYIHTTIRKLIDAFRVLERLDRGGALFKVIHTALEGHNSRLQAVTWHGRNQLLEEIVSDIGNKINDLRDEEIESLGADLIAKVKAIGKALSD